MHQLTCGIGFLFFASTSSCVWCVAECRDMAEWSQHCVQWANDGQCTFNPLLMATYCARTCNLCPTVAAATLSSQPSVQSTTQPLRHGTNTTTTMNRLNSSSISAQSLVHSMANSFLSGSLWSIVLAAALYHGGVSTWANCKSLAERLVHLVLLTAVVQFVVLSSPVKANSQSDASSSQADERTTSSSGAALRSLMISVASKHDTTSVTSHTTPTAHVSFVTHSSIFPRNSTSLKHVSHSSLAHTISSKPTMTERGSPVSDSVAAHRSTLAPQVTSATANDSATLTIRPSQRVHESTTSTSLTQQGNATIDHHSSSVTSPSQAAGLSHFPSASVGPHESAAVTSHSSMSDTDITTLSDVTETPLSSRLARLTRMTPATATTSRRHRQSTSISTTRLSSSSREVELMTVSSVTKTQHTASADLLSITPSPRDVSATPAVPSSGETSTQLQSVSNSTVSDHVLSSQSDTNISTLHVPSLLSSVQTTKSHQINATSLHSSLTPGVSSSEGTSAESVSSPSTRSGWSAETEIMKSDITSSTAGLRLDSTHPSTYLSSVLTPTDVSTARLSPVNSSEPAVMHQTSSEPTGLRLSPHTSSPVTLNSSVSVVSDRPEVDESTSSLFVVTRHSPHTTHLTQPSSTHNVSHVSQFTRPLSSDNYNNYTRRHVPGSVTEASSTQFTRGPSSSSDVTGNETSPAFASSVETRSTKVDSELTSHQPRFSDTIKSATTSHSNSTLPVTTPAGSVFQTSLSETTMYSTSALRQRQAPGKLFASRRQVTSSLI